MRRFCHALSDVELPFDIVRIREVDSKTRELKLHVFSQISKAEPPAIADKTLASIDKKTLQVKVIILAEEPDRFL